MQAGSSYRCHCCHQGLYSRMGKGEELPKHLQGRSSIFDQVEGRRLSAVGFSAMQGAFPENSLPSNSVTRGGGCCHHARSNLRYCLLQNVHGLQPHGDGNQCLVQKPQPVASACPLCLQCPFPVLTLSLPHPVLTPLRFAQASCLQLWYCPDGLPPGRGGGLGCVRDSRRAQESSQGTVV